MTQNEFYTYYSKKQNDSISHHGIAGMHWGVRRYQNYDGSLTPQGRIRYHKEQTKRISKLDKKINKLKTQIEEENDAFRIFTNLGYDTNGYSKSDFGGYVDYGKALKLNQQRLKPLKEQLKKAKSDRRKATVNKKFGKEVIK